MVHNKNALLGKIGSVVILAILGCFTNAVWSQESAPFRTRVSVYGEEPHLRDSPRYSKLYKKALMDLRYGNAKEKILAATLLGVNRKTQFIRDLSSELLKSLDETGKPYRKSATNSPYVKSQIAHALGEIGHADAIPYLQDALDKVSKIIEDEIKANEELRNKEKQPGGAPGRIIMDRLRPGPAMMKDPPEGQIYLGNPDFYWSPSDDIKQIPAPAPRYEEQRMALRSFNYVNVAQSILYALAKIASFYSPHYINRVSSPQLSADISTPIQTLEDFLQKYLEHSVIYVRGAAALALGEVGTAKALSLPVITMAPIASSASNSSSACANSETKAPLKAFIAVGRFNVIKPTAPRVSTRMFS